MPRISYSRDALDTLVSYIVRYREYFLEIYSDTGIWSESIIRDRYVLLADQRHEEILSAIEKRLVMTSVIGNTGNNLVRIPWRSKILCVQWQDDDDMRTIVELEIQ